MIEININKKQIKEVTEEVYDDFWKLSETKIRQIEKYQNKHNLKNDDEIRKVFLNNHFHLFNANVLIIIITLIWKEIVKLQASKKMKLDGNLLVCLSYFLTVMTSHTKVLRDFKFFEIAILSRYLIEACTGILENKENFKNFFKELTYEQQVQRFEKKHKEINQKIEKHLGKVGKKLYKDANVFSNPIHGTIYHVENINELKTNDRCLSILLTIHYITINKFFNIFNINFNLDFFFEVAKINEKINENFKNYLKEN